MKARIPLIMLTVQDAADRLAVSSRTVRRWIDAGELPVHRLGGVIRISEADLESFVAAHRDRGER